MAELLYEGCFMRPQDLMFGFDPDCVVPRLTTKNWRRAALVNVREGRRIYCFVARRKRTKAFGGEYVYGLYATDLDANDRYGPFGWDFPSLNEALAEANKGEPIAKDSLQRRWAEVTLVGIRGLPYAERETTEANACAATFPPARPEPTGDGDPREP